MAMNLDALQQLLERITADADAAIAGAGAIDDLRSAESKLTKGQLAEALKAIRQFQPDQRVAAGQAVNRTKNAVKQRFEAARARLRQADVAGERRQAASFDPRRPPPGTQRG